VAILGSFVAFGLEEWISKSDTYKTSLVCIKDKGVVESPKLVQTFSKYFGGTQDQMKAVCNFKHKRPF
jgi:hypothetical protein